MPSHKAARMLKAVVADAAESPKPNKVEKKEAAESPKPNKEEKEGHNLLGAPKYKKLENGRLRCVQTGHELPAHSAEAYAQSKHCRLGLIDWALARNKPPVNVFEQDPNSRSKLKCKLTGDTINKTEEHIWKHINGKRFLKMLENKEAEKEKPDEMVVVSDDMVVVPDEDTEKAKKEKKKEKKDKKKKKKDEKKKKKKTDEEENNTDEIVDEARDPEGNGSDLEKEAEFWMPPAGERWDHDDGGDRWGSDSESGLESDDVGGEDAVAEEPEPIEAGIEEVNEAVDEELNAEAVKLSKKTKRMSLESEPSPSKKKKQKTKNLSLESEPSPSKKKKQKTKKV